MYAVLNISSLLAQVPNPGLLLGLMLLAAIVGAYAAWALHLPRVIGLMVGGLLLRAILNSASGDEGATPLAEVAAPLDLVKELALGVILFAIGATLERSHIRRVGLRGLKISLCEVLCVILLVGMGCGLAAGFFMEGALADKLVMILLLALVATATAPAATLVVLQEYGAKGSNTDTLLSLVSANNICCIVLFYCSFLLLAGLGVIETTAGLGEHLWMALLMTTVGSVALGVLCGVILSVLHAKLPLGDTLLVFFALLIALIGGDKWLIQHQGLSFNYLLASLCTGAVFYNVALEPHKLDGPLRTMCTPLFAAFFVMAGYNLHVGDLVHLGWLGGAYVVCRTAGKIIGCRWGRRWAGAEDRVSPQLGSALLCQAAVAIAIAAFVQQNWNHPLADKFNTVILGSIVLFEFVGPLLLKRCVVQAGEVKAITLLRRVATSTETASVGRITLQGLLRMCGLRFARRVNPTETLLVKHIMRTNVHFIPASSTLDDLLHHIERSTHHHFPVVDDADYVGVIHFSDIREMIYDPKLRDLVTAMDLADPNAPVVPVEMPLAEVLEVFERENVGTLPVVAQAGSRRLVGEVEQRDLLRAYQIKNDE